MRSRSPLPIILAGAVVIIVAFIFLRPGDNSSSSGSKPAPTAPDSSAAKPSTSGGAGSSTKTKPAAPAPATVTVRGAKPVGGVKDIRTTKGQTETVRVTSDVPDEIHLHGYDRSADVGPGKPATLRFKADIEGIFEMELENRGVKIATLRVDP